MSAFRVLALLALIGSSLTVTSRSAAASRWRSSVEPVAPKLCVQQARHGVVGQVTTLAGRLRVRHSGQAARTVGRGAPIYAGDTLQTRTAQRATVSLCNSGLLYMDQTTMVHLSGRNRAQVQQGGLAARLQKRNPTQVQTTVAGTRGGEFFGVRVDRARATFVVLRGTLSVKNTGGAVQVKPNEASVVAARQAPSRPQSIDAQKALSWTAPLAGGWQVLVGPNQFSVPRRVAVDRQGNLYVSDQYHNRVLKLSPTGTLLAAWGKAGSGPGDPSSLFIAPYGIALDASGNIYVADAGRSVIVKLSPAGQVLARFDGSGSTGGGFNGPQGIALDGSGNIYVADTTLNRIVKLAADGTSLAVWGSPGHAAGAGPGQFSLPGDLALDAQGNIYVADSINNRIQKLSPSGQPLAQWGTRGAAPGQLYGPTDVTLDARGTIYVADTGNNRIQELASSGRVIAVMGQGGSRVGEFVSPEGVAVDTGGNLYVADRSNNRIQKYLRPPS